MVQERSSTTARSVCSARNSKLEAVHVQWFPSAALNVRGGRSLARGVRPLTYAAVDVYSDADLIGFAVKHIHDFADVCSNLNNLRNTDTRAPYFDVV